MIIDIIGYFFAFIFLSKMLAIPFVGYPTLLSSHINITGLNTKCGMNEM